MQILYAHLCDHAFLSLDGKPNLIGLLHSVNAPALPVQVDRLVVAFAVKAVGLEIDHPQEILLSLLDADGERLMETVVTVSFTAPKEVGWIIKPFFVTVDRLILPHAGPYEFVIRAGDERMTMPLEVFLTEPPVQLISL